MSAAVPARRRRALLIGVPYYEAPSIKPLEVVLDDLALVRDALKASRYDVREVDTQTLSATSASAIAKRILTFCTERESRGATLLIYFSGHGVHYNNEDRLVASDTDFGMRSLLGMTLVSVEQTAAFMESGAGTILFFVDACREGVEDAAKSAASLASWGSGKASRIASQQRATVFSCSAGQLSRYVDEGGVRYSIFSRALATVLGSGHPAATFKEVFEALTREVDELAARHGKQTQTVRLSYEMQLNDPLWDVVVADSAARATAVRDDDPWVAAVADSAVWDGMKGKDMPALKQAAVQLARHCAAQRDQAGQACAGDPWRDDAFPLRALARAEFLLGLPGPTCSLHAAEGFLLVTAPFVAAAALDAAAARFAAEAQPLDLAPRSPVAEVRDALQRMHLSLPQVARKAGTLLERGRKDEHDAIAWWLMRKAVRRSSLTWLPSQRGALSGFLPENLWRALGAAPLPGLFTDDAWREAVLTMARILFAEPDWTDRDDLPGILDDEITLSPGTAREQPFRGRMVAWLLALSGRMALDPMAMPEVVIDHIGMSDPVWPADAIALCDAVQWLPHADGRAAHAVCGHPALDIGLRECVQGADAVLMRLHERRAGKLDGLAPLEGLLRRLYDKGIQPQSVDGAPRYTTPHVTFKLAHQEVRELLMGEQLYGDPTLAIREMYQNALDACRYRAARIAFLRRTGRYEGGTWDGAIDFRQFVDDDGRTVLECRDNGIGMGRREILQAFAAVGKRFADMPEFIDEQAEWLRLDPPVRMYPNSRFGIGVLSYFMLADELELRTCRVGRDGRPGKGLVATVSSSGSLFRIREVPTPAEGAGTAVRLYLSRRKYQKKAGVFSMHTEEAEISCVRTLTELLWIAEFATSASHGDSVIHWKPKELRLPRLSRYAEEAPAPYLAGPMPDFWWHADSTREERGRLLSDGIVTQTKRFGHTVNMQGEHRPRLTVDRRHILDIDEPHLGALRLASVGALLPPPPWLDMQWLWEFAKGDPVAAQKLADMMADQDVHLPLRKEGGLVLVPLARFGLFLCDADLITACMLLSSSRTESVVEANYGMEKLNSAMPAWLLPARLAMWRDIGLQIDDISGLPDLPSPQAPFKLDIVDAELLSAQYWIGSSTRWLEAHVSPLTLLTVAHKMRWSMGQARDRFARFEPMGLVIDVLPADVDDRRIDDVDMKLLDLRVSRYIRERTLSPIMPMDLLARAAHAGISPQEAHDRLLVLTAVLGMDPPAFDGAWLAEPVTPEDLALLSRDGDGQAPWLTGEISARHLVRSAVRLNQAMPALIDRIVKLSALGVSAPRVPPAALSMDWHLADAMGLPLLADTDRVAMADVVGHAAHASKSLAEAWADFKVYQDAGYALPSLPEGTSALRVDATDLKLLSRDLDGKAPWRDEAPGMARLIALQAESEGVPADLMQRLGRLAPVFGWRLPEPDLQALARIGNDDLEIAAICDVSFLKAGTDHAIAIWHIVIVAALLDTHLRAAHGRLEKFAAVGCSLAEVPAGLDALQPTEQELLLFLEMADDQLQALRLAPSWEDVLAHAQAHDLEVDQVLQDARKYEPLGVSLPSPPGPTA